MSAAFAGRSQCFRLALILAVLFLGALGLSAAQSGDAVLPRLGVTRGICVVLGDTKGDLAVKLARESELLIYVQLPRSEDVAAVRRAAAEAGLYGTRIYVEQGNLTPLYLADNVADALVAVGDATALPDAEAMRVLRPQGKAIRGERELVKPVPEGADAWSHPYHGPDNNPQSQDRVAKGP
jgi:hypothetical protein